MRLLGVVASVCLGLALSLPAWSQAAAAWSDEEVSQEEAELAAWVKRLDEARDRVTGARQRVGELEERKGRGAARRYPRGDAKAKYLADLEAARTELEEAERALPELMEEARRAGVPPGVLSDYEEVAGES